MALQKAHDNPTFTWSLLNCKLYMMTEIQKTGTKLNRRTEPALWVNYIKNGEEIYVTVTVTFQRQFPCGVSCLYFGKWASTDLGMTFLTGKLIKTKAD